MSLARDGRLQFEKRYVEEGMLKKLLREKAATGRKRPVLVRADHNIPYGRVIAVVDAIREAGFTQVGFVTQGVPGLCRRAESVSQELYQLLHERSRIGVLGWPLGLALSLGFHGLVAGRDPLFAQIGRALPRIPRITWVTLPAMASAGPAGGSTAHGGGQAG